MENQTHPLIVLPSGLTLLVVERPNSKAFAATMTLPVGTNHSPFEHPQLAHLVEHLAFLVGNRQETERLNGVGAYVNGCTADEYTQYQVYGHIDLIEPSLQFLLGVLSPELIGQEDLDRERRVLLKEYIQHGPGRQRRCDFLAAQQARRLQAANKLDLPVAEYGKTLDGIGVARANDFRAMHYRHEFARLVVVSTFSADEIVRLLPSATAESARTTPHSAPRRTAYVEREHFIWNGNRSSHVSVTYLSENSSPLRQFVGDTLQDQLHNRQDSPFYRYLRQQLGKTYSIDVSFTRLFDRSKLMVSLAIDKRDVHGCWVWIIDQLARLAAEGWTEGTYERIRQRFIRKQDLWFEGAYQVATYLGCELLRDESQRMLSPQDYRSLAENATLESVNQELRKLLAPQNRFTTIVGPIRMFGKWRLRRQLAALGNDQATVNSGSEATR